MSVTNWTYWLVVKLAHHLLLLVHLLLMYILKERSFSHIDAMFSLQFFGIVI